MMKVQKNVSLHKYNMCPEYLQALLPPHWSISTARLSLPQSGQRTDFPGAHVELQRCFHSFPPQAHLSFLLYFCVIKDAMYAKVPTVNTEGKSNWLFTSSRPLLGGFMNYTSLFRLKDVVYLDLKGKLIKEESVVIHQPTQYHHSTCIHTS